MVIAEGQLPLLLDPMWRSAALYLFGQHAQAAQLRVLRCQAPRVCFGMMLHTEARNPVTHNDIGKEGRTEYSFPVGQKISRREKINFLFKALLDAEDTKDAVYGTLDAWVAWEQNFPIAPLKNVLLALEREQQWHRVVQVIKWMLSKGQGNTIGTYQQLIRALDMDHRAEEAHNFWMKKIGNDFHSVPWQTCHVMISVYYRNNMLDHLVKLFRGLEAFGRKPTEKKIVQKVADAYEQLGLVDEKERIMEKYADLFRQSRTESDKKSKRLKSKIKGT